MSGSLAGEDGLAGASLAQWETKWNLEYSTVRASREKSQRQLENSVNKVRYELKSYIENNRDSIEDSVWNEALYLQTLYDFRNMKADYMTVQISI